MRNDVTDPSSCLLLLQPITIINRGGYPTNNWTYILTLHGRHQALFLPDCQWMPLADSDIYRFVYCVETKFQLLHPFSASSNWMVSINANVITNSNEFLVYSRLTTGALSKPMTMPIYCRIVHDIWFASSTGKIIFGGSVHHKMWCMAVSVRGADRIFCVHLSTDISRSVWFITLAKSVLVPFACWTGWTVRRI